MNFAEFRIETAAYGIVLTDLQISQFANYLRLLQTESELMNLTAIKDEAGIIEKHFLDSLLIADKYPFTNQTLLDLGSGAGFPGIPLKIAFPKLKVTLLEPTTKKARFLAKVINNLDLRDITVIAERAETFAERERERFDLVTARAVSQLNILLELALPLVRVNGTFVAYKGAKADEEIQASQQALKKLGGSILEVVLGKLPTENDRRALIIVKKHSATPLEYPRNYGAIKKRPL